MNFLKAFGNCIGLVKACGIEGTLICVEHSIDNKVEAKDNGYVLELEGNAVVLSWICDRTSTNCYLLMIWKMQ